MVYLCGSRLAFRLLLHYNVHTSVSLQPRLCMFSASDLCLCVCADKKAEVRRACIVRWCLVHTQSTCRRRRRLRDTHAPVVAVTVLRRRDTLTVVTDNDELSWHTASSCRRRRRCKHSTLLYSLSLHSMHVWLSDTHAPVVAVTVLRRRDTLTVVTDNDELSWHTASSCRRRRRCKHSTPLHSTLSHCTACMSDCLLTSAVVCWLT